METIEKLKPITIQVSGHRAIVSDKVFGEIIDVINKQTEVINFLLEKDNTNSNAINTLNESLKALAQSLTNL